MKNKAFTLIELLVVIAIISIIAAILFPVLARAREKARQSTCASNEWQLGLAIQQYVQDNDEMLPVSGSDEYPFLVMNGTMWAGLIYPYVKNAKVFQCPDDSGTPAGVTFSNVHYRLYPVTYAYNSNLMGWVTNFRTTGILGKSSLLNSPAKTVMLCETRSTIIEPNTASGNPMVDLEHANEHGGVDNYNVSPGALGGFEAVTGSNFALLTGNIGGRPDLAFPVKPGLHTDGSNFLMCDGHVKWLRGEVVSSGFSYPQSQHPASCQDQDYYLAPAGTECADKWVATFSPI